jgi:hypothetical protein
MKIRVDLETADRSRRRYSEVFENVTVIALKNRLEPRRLLTDMLILMDDLQQILGDRETIR